MTSYQLRLDNEDSYEAGYAQQFRKIITMEQIKEMDLIANHLNYNQLKHYCKKKEVHKYSWYCQSTNKHSMRENLFSYILYGKTSLKWVGNKLGTEPTNLICQTIYNFRNVPNFNDFIYLVFTEE